MSMRGFVLTVAAICCAAVWTIAISEAFREARVLMHLPVTVEIALRH